MPEDAIFTMDRPGPVGWHLLKRKLKVMEEDDGANIAPDWILLTSPWPAFPGDQSITIRFQSAVDAVTARLRLST